MSVFGGPALDNEGRILPELRSHAGWGLAGSEAPPPPVAPQAPPLRAGAITSEAYNRLPARMQPYFTQIRGADGATQWLSRFSLANEPADRDTGPHRVTEDEYAKMTSAEKLEYTRQFDQNSFPANRHDVGAR
jgi:hypothetical protein